MGKSKKRNRTKALYEAAAAAKRRMLMAKDGKTTQGSGVLSAVVDVDAVTIDTRTITPTTTPSGRETTATQSSLPQHQQERTDSALRQQHCTNGEPSPSEIATTLKTIRHLAKFPDLFLHSKDYKELRRALHPLVTERLKSYDKGIDYRQKVTLHLSHKRWSAALSSLEAIRDFQQIPKQGTVQRWVRDVDLCENGPVKIRLLTSILGCKTATSDNGSTNHMSSDNHGSSETEEETITNGVVGTNKHDPALALIEAQKSYQTKQSNNKATNISSNTNEGIEATTNSELKVLKGWSIPSSSSTTTESSQQNDGSTQGLQTLKSRIVYREKAAERTPPNRYDLLLHATEASAVLPLPNTTTLPRRVVTKHQVPFLTGAFLLENVLSHSECSRLVRAASILGYRPDHPTNLEAPTGIDSCEWLVDPSIHDLVYDRVREHLPLSMGETNDSNQKKRNSLCGINKRWRFFRYGQNCVYRPHIDGSWPAGSLSEDGTSYELDTSGKTRSYLTFLIYLNDGFEGGETKFYYPETKGATALVARGIVPHKGCVLVFPQGNTASLLHEGSAVTKGTKYVVRTDVLYEH